MPKWSWSAGPKLDHPYLVAPNAFSNFHTEEAVVDALLGTPYVEITKMPDGREKIDDCPSSDNLRLIRRFAKGGSGSSGVRV